MRGDGAEKVKDSTTVEEAVADVVVGGGEPPSWEPSPTSVGSHPLRHGGFDRELGVERSEVDAAGFSSRSTSRPLEMIQERVRSSPLQIAALVEDQIACRCHVGIGFGREELGGGTHSS